MSRKTLKKCMAVKIQNTAKKLAQQSVGKSVFITGHEMKIPKSVQKWVKEN